MPIRLLYMPLSLPSGFAGMKQLIDKPAFVTYCIQPCYQVGIKSKRHHFLLAPAALFRILLTVTLLLSALLRALLFLFHIILILIGEGLHPLPGLILSHIPCYKLFPAAYIVVFVSIYSYNATCISQKRTRVHNGICIALKVAIL